MPGPDTLQWTEFADFSGGLWERKSDRECPQNGALELTDCYPQQRGGLAAFARFEPVSQTGLVANSVILACKWARPPFPQGRLRLATLEIDAIASGVHRFRVYSMAVNTLDSIKTGTWNVDMSLDNVTVCDPSIQIVEYRDGTMGYRCWVNTPIAQSTAAGSTGTTNYLNQGVWRLGATAASTSTASSGSTRRIKTTQQAGGISSNAPLWYGALASHQARLMYTVTFDQLHNRIGMTSQGGQIGTTDFVDPLGEKAGALTWMMPSQSDYMVAAKSQVGALVIQGAFPNPTNRQTNFSHNYLQSFPCATDAGVFYMAADDACYMAGQSAPQNITPNFYGTPMNPGLYRNASGDSNFFNVANSDNIKLGQPALGGDFLFAGKGYVMDMRTQAWFKTSYLPDAKNFTTDTAFFRTFASDNTIYTGSNQVLRYGYFLENSDTTTDTWNPSPSYSFTTPLISNPHQQTQVREIEYHIDAFKSGSTIKVEVYTPSGQAFERTYEVPTTGPQKVRCSGIKAAGAWVKIRTTIASDPKHGAPNEAPLMERMLVGTVVEDRTVQATRKGAS